MTKRKKSEFAPDPVVQRWFDALDTPDSGAWDDLDRVRAEVPDDHLVRRVIDFLSLDPAERRPRSTPIVGYCAERVRSEPGAFARCTVDLASYGSFFHKTEDTSPRFVAEHLVAKRPLLGLLAATHNSEAWKTLDPFYGTTSVALYEAHRRTLAAEPGPMTWEIRVSLLELETEVYHAALAVLAVDRVLGELVPLVDDCPIPHRHIPVLYRLARHLVSTDRPEEAATVLDRADQELPADLDDALRVDILTLRRFAAAMQGEAHYDEASSHRERLNVLLRKYGIYPTTRHARRLESRVLERVAELDHEEELRAKMVDPRRSTGHAYDALHSAQRLRQFRAELLTTGGGGAAAE